MVVAASLWKRKNVHQAVREILMTTAVMGFTLAASTAAHADSASCQGRITAIANHTPGSLYIALTTMAMVRVCDFDADHNGLSPADCRHIASMAALAVATEKEVAIIVDNAPTTNCASIPSWHSASTRYFLLIP